MFKIVLYFFILIFNLYSQSNTLILGDKYLYPLNEYIDYLEDNENKYSIQDILKEDVSKKFIPFPKNKTHFEIKDHHLWFRFKIKQNPQAENQEWIFTTNSAHIQYINFYYFQDAKWKSFKSGYKRPMKERPLIHTKISFPIPHHSNENEITYFIEIDNAVEFHLNLEIINQKQYILNIFWYNTIIGIFSGFMIILIIFHITMFFILKDINYLNFSIYVILHFSYYLMIQFYHLMFIDYDSLFKIIKYPTYTIAFLQGASLIWFIIHFMDLKQFKVINLFMYSSFYFFLFIAIIIRYFSIIDVLLISIPISIFIAIIVIGILIYLFPIKPRPIQFFIIAEIFSLFADILISTQLILPIFSYKINTAEFISWIFVCISSFFFAFAIADMYFYMKSEKEKAIAVADSKSKLIGYLAHQVKTQLDGFRYIFDKSNSNLKLNSELLTKINSSIDNTMEYIQKILSLNNLQKNNLSINLSKINFNHFIDLMFVEIHCKANQKNIILLNRIPKDFIISIDIVLFKQVFINLLDNSIKFSNNNGMIQVYLQKNNEIVIEDKGVGISKEKIPHLFSGDKDVSTIGTNNEIGFGIGLALCKEIISLHGGKIQIESEVGEGTKFIIGLF